MVVSWPGVIKPGTSCNTHVTSMDFFPTFVHAAGGSTDQIKQLEGLDLKPLFEDGSKQLDRDALFWHFPHNRPDVKYYMGSTIVKGDWKYYRGYGLIKDALFNLRERSKGKVQRAKQDNSNVVERHEERTRSVADQSFSEDAKASKEETELMVCQKLKSPSCNFQSFWR